MVYNVTRNNIHIEDSAFISKKEMDAILVDIFLNHGIDTEVFFLRSKKSLKREWALHNLLYSWGLFKSHTKDVDLNVPCHLEWMYNLAGAIALLIIK